MMLKNLKTLLHIQGYILPPIPPRTGCSYLGMEGHYPKPSPYEEQSSTIRPDIPKLRCNLKLPRFKMKG